MMRYFYTNTTSLMVLAVSVPYFKYRYANFKVSFPFFQCMKINSVLNGQIYIFKFGLRHDLKNVGLGESSTVTGKFIKGGFKLDNLLTRQVLFLSGFYFMSRKQERLRSELSSTVVFFGTITPRKKEYRISSYIFLP